MHWFRFAVLLVVVMLLQAGLIDVITISGIKPDLLLILLVFFAIYREPEEAIITSFAIGFGKDIIGPSMGPGTISFGLLGTGLCYLTRFISIRRMPYQAIVIFLLGICTSVAAYCLGLIQPGGASLYHFGIAAWSSLYSAVVGPFLFLPVAWWMRIRVHRYRRR